MARSWTKEQQMAIDTEGTNIIVSAGAGSGKTAVLTERVLRKLKSGIHINQLLVLTFTKAAAYEMKERIRKAIKREPSLKEELDLIDGAYITTFDSYALSIVKKYHYLKNITSHVQICESTILSLEKIKYLEEIMTEYYEKEDPRFEKLIQDFCVKDDQEIKDAIFKILSKLEMKYDKETYLREYQKMYFNPYKIEKDILEFTELLQNKIKEISHCLEVLSPYVNGDYEAALFDILNPLLESKTYDEISSHLDLKLPNLPRGSEEEAKRQKEKMGSLLKELKELCIYDSTEAIQKSILACQDYVSVILDILIELDKKITAYKEENDLFEFGDIAKLAITLLKENEEIREEIKQGFQEILVDEYQDTNDIQELFISLIAKDNVYMVGDIKQSIYRFRNANPLIFKNKYDSYSKLQGGMKIDLNKNFRSRKEVLDNINLLFDSLMDNVIGGAEYQESHRMVFGNTTYSKQGQTNTDHNLEIYTYQREKDSPYSKEEYEIFLIAKDMKKKVEEGYLVFDKDELLLRPIRYQDFVILLDRTTQFDLYKKIFEYMEIPLSLYKDEVITSSFDIKMLKNLLRLIVEVKNQTFTTRFRYSFMSVGRSFLMEYEDDVLFHYLKDNTFKESSLYQKIEVIAREMDHLTCSSLFDRIIETFDYYQAMIRLGNVESAMVRIDYLKQLGQNLESLGYNIYDFLNYMETLIDEKYDIKLSSKESSQDSAKIMTIHKSKGLEYHICYYAGLSVSFNLRDMKEKILFDETYGIITPFYQEGIAPTIYKALIKYHYLLDEISEKIRLFYVALTRCKEKMIMVTSLDEEEEELQIGEVVEDAKRMQYRCFRDMLNSVHSILYPFLRPISTNDIPLTKDYLFHKEKELQNLLNEEVMPIEVEEVHFVKETVEEKQFSKKQFSLLQKEEKQQIDLGLKFHEILEKIDLVHPDLASLKLSPFMTDKITLFLKQDFFKKEHAKIYREYEFIQEDEKHYAHGIIDLLIVLEKEAIIVDYKLKNIKDDAYRKQLFGYQKIVESLFSKPTKIYLYSILDGKTQELLS